MGNDDLTEKIIGCAYTVSNTLGAGFLEKVYENALAVELTKNGLDISVQHPIRIEYRGKVVGDYYADIFVENNVVVELKAVSELTDIHQAQLMNYLRATKVRTGLLLNFGKPKVQVKRMLNGY